MQLKKALVLSLYAIIIIIAILFLPRFGNCNGGNNHCWSRWDSGLYLDIAKNGLVLHECGPKEGWPENSGAFCGNCGWAPAYPFLIRTLSPLFKTMSDAGVFISGLFLFLAILRITLYQSAMKHPLWYLYGLLFLVPLGSIYYYAVFPLSMALFFMVSAIIAWKKDNWLALGLYSAILIWVYSTGFMFAACAVFMAGIGVFKDPKKGIKTGLTVGVPVIISAALFFGMYQLVVGHWDALFLTQAKYGHNLQSPLKIAGLRWEKLAQDWGELKAIIEVHNYLSFSFLFFGIYYVYLKRNLNALLMLLLIVVTSAIPYSLGTEVSVYRNVSLMAPFVLFLSFNKLWHFGLTLLIYLFFFFPMAKLFFYSILY